MVAGKYIYNACKRMRACNAIFNVMCLCGKSINCTICSVIDNCFLYFSYTLFLTLNILKSIFFFINTQYFLFYTSHIIHHYKKN